MLRKKVARHKNVKVHVSFNPLICDFRELSLLNYRSRELSRHVDKKKYTLQSERDNASNDFILILNEYDRNYSLRFLILNVNILNRFNNYVKIILSRVTFLQENTFKNSKVNVKKFDEILSAV